MMTQAYYKVKSNQQLKKISKKSNQKSNNKLTDQVKKFRKFLITLKSSFQV